MRTTFLTALFAVLAFGAMAAAGASAAQPLFLNGNGSAKLSFTGAGGLVVLRFLEVGVLATIDCEKTSVTGETVYKSMEAVKVVFSFDTKCEQKVGTTKTTCTEPTNSVSSFVELGLPSSTNNKTVLELVAPESGTSFVTFSCGSTNTTFEGIVVGEIPPENANKEAQYNKQRSSLEAVFAAVGKTSENQVYSGLLLLGTQMTGTELKVTKFFGDKASFEVSVVTKPPVNGTVELSTKF